MTALVQALSRMSSAASLNVDLLVPVAIFCGLGLVISVVLALHGLDINAGLF